MKTQGKGRVYALCYNGIQLVLHVSVLLICIVLLLLYNINTLTRDIIPLLWVTLAVTRLSKIIKPLDVVWISPSFLSCKQALLGMVQHFCSNTIVWIYISSFVIYQSYRSHPFHSYAFQLSAVDDDGSQEELYSSHSTALSILFILTSMYDILKHGLHTISIAFDLQVEEFIVLKNLTYYSVQLIALPLELYYTYVVALESLGPSKVYSFLLLFRAISLLYAFTIHTLDSIPVLLEVDWNILTRGELGYPSVKHAKDHTTITEIIASPFIIPPDLKEGVEEPEGKEFVSSFVNELLQSFLLMCRGKWKESYQRFPGKQIVEKFD